VREIKGNAAVRVIAGKWRGKKLETPEGNDIRPTSDRARGALFNVLAHGKPAAMGFHLQDATVLDAFAGTGALGLEALSRGAKHARFIENTATSIAVLRANIDTCGAERVSDIHQADATNPPAAGSACGLILMDPPYGKDLLSPSMDALSINGWMAGGAICCAELGKDEAFKPPCRFEILDDRRYGAARIVILVWRG
jgi:16S rRNA (guanine966-N2)-methyltransferase